MSADNTKEKIENAAKKLFAERGFDSVTTREIAAEAGVNLSSLNYHFKTKDQLLIHLAEKFIQGQERAVLSSLPEVSSFAEFELRSEVFIDTMIMSLFQDIQLFKMFHGEIERRNPILLENANNPSNTLIPSLIKFFKLAQKNGYLAADIDPQMAAMIIFKEIIHTVSADDVKHFTIPGSLQKDAYRKKWIQSLLRIVFGGIKAPEVRLKKDGKRNT